MKNSSDNMDNSTTNQSNSDFNGRMVNSRPIQTQNSQLALENEKSITHLSDVFTGFSHKIGSLEGQLKEEKLLNGRLEERIINLEKRVGNAPYKCSVKGAVKIGLYAGEVWNVTKTGIIAYKILKSPSF